MTTKPRIGFIGLGLMGSAMVERLQSLGYPLTVIANRSRTRIDEAVARGAEEADSVAGLASGSDIVMLCVDTSDAVESVMNGPKGVIAAIPSGALVIDFGTSKPDSTRRIGETLAEKGVEMLDAPLGRTPAHGREGKLNIMAAGTEAAFARAEPVLRDLGENVFHVGSLGAGHTLKLINNYFAMTTACAMSEAFAVADIAGLKRETLYDVMAAGPLRSGMMDFIKANAIDGKPDMLAFSIANAAKDVGYYREMSELLGFQSFIALGTDEQLRFAKDSGWSNRLVPEMVDLLAEKLASKHRW